MNEDSVALIMCEKCVYRVRILKKKNLELSVNIFLKDTSCFYYGNRDRLNGTAGLLYSFEFDSVKA